jgi:two-component system KDP operon response regulator KdpE
VRKKQLKENFNMTGKVLIIDDEADIRFLLRRALTSRNYSVLEAQDLKQGFELYNKTEPDIIILDVNLPDGNGVYYARKFKNDKNMVIFISANNDKLADGGFKDVGASGFLRKPFIIEQLLEVINNIKINTSNLN